MHCRGSIKEYIEVYTEDDIDLLIEEKEMSFNSSLFFLLFTITLTGYHYIIICFTDNRLI